jgi:magnesium-transporting ATPase (P-type)
MNIDKIIKHLKDIVSIIFLVVIIYFFIFGAINWMESHEYCDYTEGFHYHIMTFNMTTRINMLQLKAYVNTSGFFDNAYVYSDNQFISNCSFIK